MNRQQFSRKSKYALVGERVAHLGACTLVDIGARDRILARSLPAQVQYRSADVIPGHDYQWNLEDPLPLADASVDVIVCLDVLEHLENIHLAYGELLRVARKTVFIVLPNISHLANRLQFLFTGSLGGKYALLPTHQGDRHRWVTIYPQMAAFIQSQAAAQGAQVTQWDILGGHTRLERLLNRLPLPAPLRTYASLFEIQKPESK